ncbi:hypothetical protein C8R43DRAFT_1082400 [Mycena crocata]|nr:hypothetical protein C8R43DRAFT_1082400 [Mycena crocata]
MADSPFLRASLAEINQEMADVHQRMAELQAKLAHLFELRKPILASLQAIFYPVATLPTEITAEIFVHYVDTAHIGGVGGTIADPPRLKGGGHGPLLLASVCRAWREIALGLQSIWSRMEIFTIPDYLWATEKLIQCWLPRAGSHALDIDIGIPEVTNFLVTTLAPYSPQWEAFACGVDAPATFPAGELIRGRLPLLRKLELALCVPEEEVDTPLSVFADAPELRQVRLIDYTLDSVTLPWAQLTDLKLSGQDPFDCIRILLLTPNLETLSVSARRLLSQPTPIHLPRLHSLKLQDNFDSYELLRCLTVPALTHLELDYLSRPLWPPIVHFLRRSACSLRTLTLRAPDVDAALALFRVVPTLRTLHVADATWSEGALTMLCDALVQIPGFLSNLRSLVLNPCTTAVELPYAELADMLAARWAGRENDSDAGVPQSAVNEPVRFAQLESFEIVLSPGSNRHSPPDMAGIKRGLGVLQALAARGQKIHIRGLHKISGVVGSPVRPFFLLF